MKVAQYEVLGNEAKNRSVPAAAGTIETVGFWSLARGSAIASIRRSSRSSFVVLTMADRPGRIAL